MLNAIIRFSLQYRLVTIAIALAVAGWGLYETPRLPIDVFPDLNRPRVTVITEMPGMAAEEVESLVTFPLESAINGATGVKAVRSSSVTGASIVNVEFGWETNVYIARQIVNEKLSLSAEQMPAGARPFLAPISSIIGQIVYVGVSSEGGETDPMEVRTLADWVIRPRLLTIPGVAQVLVMGGGRKQFQVLVNPEELLRYDVSLQEVERAVSASNANATGGYLDLHGSEYLVRSLGRVRTAEDLQSVVVKVNETRPVRLGMVARVVEAPQVKRGDSAVDGKPAVLLLVSKQPGADTRALTDAITAALKELQATLPSDIRINPEVYQQKTFIDLSIRNVEEALRDGGILVVIILFLFLLNFRTTFITLTAIPLSLLVTAVVFRLWGESINTMTLGGLAVAIGELVDDAIVDVENIFRRLRENRSRIQPRPALRVVYEASLEVRSSIVFSTMLVVLVFVPMLGLEGIEGRLFAPLATAYITSILASLVVSLTVTPVLSYWLLPNAPVTAHNRDGLLLRVLKWIADKAIRFSLAFPRTILAAVAAATVIAALVVTTLGGDLLPPFNEGAVQVNLVTSPGVSLATSNQLAGLVDAELLKIDGIVGVSRRTGRAELDEHFDGVNSSEIVARLDPASKRTRDDVLEDIRGIQEIVPGTVLSVEQPLQHAISHMLSGVKAAIGVKIYGDDLNQLRAAAEQVRAAIETVPGTRDLFVERLKEVPQLQVRVKRDRLAEYGLNSNDVNVFVETAMQGRKVSEVVLGQRRFDLVVRLDDPYRNDPDQLRRLNVNLPGGGRVPLTSVADVVLDTGPNLISRERVRRRIIVQSNVQGRDLVSVANDIRAKLKPIESTLPVGYFMEFSGKYETYVPAVRRLVFLSLAALAGVFLVLYTLFRSVNLSLQVMASLPMAAVGAVAALVLTQQSLTVSAMVGFITLVGIASRNGILLIGHYLHLVRHEGEQFTQGMIIRAGLERLSPMLMTALTSGIGLAPLVWAADQPGREILYPVATVIVGGLVSSTLLDFLVHPALFWLYGRGDAERGLHGGDADAVELASADSHP
jgi:HME family heavy-metal exporter